VTEVEHVRGGTTSGMAFVLSMLVVGAVLFARELARGAVARAVRSASERRAWKHGVVIGAGFAATYLGVAAIAFALYSCHGLESTARWYGVLSTVDGFGAHGKVAPGDRIVAVDHVALEVDRGESLAARVARSHGAPVTLTVMHGGEARDVTITPKLDTDGSALRLGIKTVVDRDLSTDLGGALDAAASAPIDETIRLVRTLFVGADRPDPGGPVRIVDAVRVAPEGLGVEVGRHAVRLGVYLLWIMLVVDLGRVGRKIGA
jgi:hypothetical protein